MRKPKGETVSRVRTFRAPSGRRTAPVPAPNPTAGQDWRLVDAVPEGVVPLLQVAAALAVRRDETFLRASYGLSSAQYQFLLEVHKGGEITLTTAARRLGCTKGNVTGLAARLERDGYLLRERSPLDRRLVRVRLTEKGQAIWGAREALSREHERVAHALDRDDRSRLAALLRKLLSALAGETEAGDER